MNQAAETPPGAARGPIDPAQVFWALRSLDRPPEGVAPTRAAEVRRGLMVWLAVLAALGIGGLLSGVQELSAMIAFAGVFVAAQAADVDPRWFAPYAVLGAVVPLGGAAVFGFLANGILHGDAPPALRIAGVVFSIASGAFSLFTLNPAVIRRLTRLLFRSADDSHALHLAARVVSLTFLQTFPTMLVVGDLLQSASERPGGFFQSSSLGAELIGYIAIALAGVGFLIRRPLAGTLERLGLRRPRWSDLGRIAAGTGGLFALNFALEWMQHQIFPGTWRHDHAINEQLAHGITAPVGMLLGATAGIGEEITLRGALQPRLGLFLTSAMFAALHVQYSWFGMLAILLIGMVLGLLRARAGTTVAMAVHALYDVLAVFTTS
ncbi:MAG TPA: CPBP family intramembrane glutamic endopeptidase [Candidatus Udaeobacter sp.]|nr:CPBP family intramembrane glutamic endopeptidase [Candidatus Udaeobacter sp.]